MVFIESNNRKSVESLKQYSFVKSVYPFSSAQSASSIKGIDFPDIEMQIEQLNKKVTGVNTMYDSGFYGNSRAQIHQLLIDSLHASGYTGIGVRVAIFDNGFRNLQNLRRVLNYFERARFGGSKNFVRPTKSVFAEGDHGVAVLSIMATYKPGLIVGSSPDAIYYLMCTEDDITESPLEELFWLMAAEFCDSIGVDIIQSSLGYNEFDEEAYSHQIKQLDGKTTLISKAASVAVSKGIVVVNSAGNEGDKDWRFIAAPADVEGVITVGGVDMFGNMAMFSSQGPTADKRVKPDVSAMAEGTFSISASGVVNKGNGTSYATPLISGMVACLLQAFPNATPDEIRHALRISADHYFKPDIHFGYGIPKATLALGILESEKQMEDSVIHITQLSDQNIHALVYSKQAQTYTWKVEDAQGRIVAHGSRKMKKAGADRFILFSTKKVGKGNYVLKVTTANKVINHVFSN
jgi:subtilisin family serine protease